MRHIQGIFLIVGSALGCAAESDLVAPQTRGSALTVSAPDRCEREIFDCCWDRFPVACGVSSRPQATRASGAVALEEITPQLEGFVHAVGSEKLERRPLRSTHRLALRSGSIVQFAEVGHGPAGAGVLVSELGAPGVLPLTSVALQHMNPLELYILLGGDVNPPRLLTEHYRAAPDLPRGLLNETLWPAHPDPVCDPGGPSPQSVAAWASGHEETFFSAGDGPSTKPQHWWLSSEGSPNDVYALQGSAHSVLDFSAAIGFCNRDDVSSFPSPGHPRYAWIQSRESGTAWGEDSYVVAELEAPGQVLVGTLASVSTDDAFVHDFRVLIDLARPGDTFHIAAGWDGYVPVP
jgi:hypothetical protein